MAVAEVAAGRSGSRSGSSRVDLAEKRRDVCGWMDVWSTTGMDW